MLAGVEISREDQCYSNAQSAKIGRTHLRYRSGTGYLSSSSGPRIPLRRLIVARSPTTRRTRPHRSPGDSARVEGRVDLPAPQRTPSGVRPGCARPQAVPVSPRMAAVPRRGRSTTRCSPSRLAFLRCGARSQRISPRPGLPRRKVVAAVVQLLEKTLIRVGNDEYARDNNSFGLTTMRNKHVRVSKSTLRFRFKGKGGKSHDIAFNDVRLARIVRRCQDLPGHELFGYVDDDGNVQDIGSADVNAYLREVTGQDFTAKSFRTWAATVLAACALPGAAEFRSNAQAKRNFSKAVEAVAGVLGKHSGDLQEELHPPGDR